MATFRSPHARLHIAFPPNVFGYTKRGKEEVPHTPVVFEGGLYTTDDPEEIERLRRHPSAKDTPDAGKLFEEDSEEVENLVRKTQPKGMAAPIEGLSPDDRALLKEAGELAGSLNKANLAKGRKIADKLIKRFDLRGVEDFSGVKTPNGGKAVLLSMLDVIEQQLPQEEDADQGGGRAG